MSFKQPFAFAATARRTPDGVCMETARGSGVAAKEGKAGTRLSECPLPLLC